MPCHWYGPSVGQLYGTQLVGPIVPLKILLFHLGVVSTSVTVKQVCKKCFTTDFGAPTPQNCVVGQKIAIHATVFGCGHVFGIV